MRESLKVLQECAELQQRKSKDYQNEKSRIRQADHYPRGCATILDMVHQKITRIYSVMEAMEQGETANFESLEDSAKDAINYLSFFVSYSRGKMEGQDTKRDLVNRPIKIDGSKIGGNLNAEG
jgi:hypothetical protein